VTYGNLENTDDGRYRLRFTRALAHPVEKVWQAVTEPEHLAHWFPTTIEGERAVGAPLRFSFPGEQAPPFDGEMLAYEPPRLMELRWGPDVVRLELRPTSSGTELILTDTLDERGKAVRDAAGWHVCLDSLEADLQADPGAREKMSSWHEVQPHYLASFPPEAATIGPPEGFE
jgi:uncharacterized protein YndB with AHSA1/START domain